MILRLVRSQTRTVRGSFSISLTTRMHVFVTMRKVYELDAGVRLVHATSVLCDCSYEIYLRFRSARA